MAEYTFEFVDPRSHRCDCCGGLTVELTRYVTRDGDPCAFYQARYANNHPDHELAMLISFDEDVAPRVTFFCRVRPTDGSYSVMLGDARQSGWSAKPMFGKLLSRDEALAHRAKPAAFELLDAAFVQDPSLAGFIERSQHACGLGIPLQRRFGAPDTTHGTAAPSALVSADFLVRERRCFVRASLDIPVEGYDAWSIGVWIELERADFDRLAEARERPTRHAQLRVPGTLANDVAQHFGLPVPRGAQVELETSASDELLRIRAAGDVQAFLSERWSKERFERYAIKRGYL